MGRRMQTGTAFGALFRRLGNANATGSLPQELARLGLDEPAAAGAEDLIHRQLAATGVLPDDRTILVEHFRDETGNPQMMAHSVFGRPVNEPLAILASEAATRLTNVHISHVDDDDGFLLFPYDDRPLPGLLLQRIAPESARPVLAAMLTATPLFNMAFRYNAARALMMGLRKAGRQPLWVQRMRSAELLDSLARNEIHPLIRETRRECLEDYWDLAGVEKVLDDIRTGAIQVREMYLDAPSPLSLPLRQKTEAAMMYDYAPTTPGIRLAAEEALAKSALSNAQPLAPAPEQLTRISERKSLPENESRLHTLLMIEGDLLAGELEVSVQWLEQLARQEQAAYIEPGLWIAAEHLQEYAATLADGDPEARVRIVRRLLRYRGAQSPEQVAERYLWTEEAALEVLQELCRQEAAVESDGLYYHEELYERARRETIHSRRRQIRTLPAERYAALLAGGIDPVTAPPGEKLEMAIQKLSGIPYPPVLWESVLLPLRVSGYRPELLDALLAQGHWFWRITPDAGLAFYPYSEIDWDADPAAAGTSFEGKTKIAFEALVKRGAVFMHRLSDVLGEESPQDTLLELAEAGLACADSFVPIRQWLNREKMESFPLKQRAKARVTALTAGRWEAAHPLKEVTPEQALNRAFDKAVIVCRETVQGMPWAKALEILRVWEYTGRARRGYFIEGLSGIQFIREKDYAATMLELEQPQDRIRWLPASDPAQPWGKCLPHRPDGAFLQVPGTVVGLRAGMPVAVFERQGKLLRVFDPASLPDALLVFAHAYTGRQIFPTLTRLTVKQYPAEAADALIGAGFMREMQDFVIYRGYR